MTRTYDNSGSLSRNERKEQPNHADYRGKATIDGVEYWISAWIKTGENGKWLSLSFKPKEEAPTTRRAKDEPGDAPDSDLPF